MNIAVIGTGNVGASLARAWSRKGHRIFLGTRSPLKSSLRELVAYNEDLISAHAPEVAAKKADVILLAIPADVAFEVVQQLGLTDGKIIIDVMNPGLNSSLQLPRTSEAIFSARANSKIVKAFNMVGAENMDNPIYGETVADLFICGNEAECKIIVAQLGVDAGFRVFDIGGLEMEIPLEHLALIWSKLAFTSGLGREIAFKVLQR